MGGLASLLEKNGVKEIVHYTFQTVLLQWYGTVESSPAKREGGGVINLCSFPHTLIGITRIWKTCGGGRGGE